jgi:hypothetical protein
MTVKDTASFGDNLYPPMACLETHLKFTAIWYDIDSRFGRYYANYNSGKSIFNRILLDGNRNLPYYPSFIII